MSETAPFIASEAEAIAAREAGERLKPFADGERDVTVSVVGRPDVVVPIPGRALRLITDVLGVVAQGTALSLVPHDRALTTTEAADLLDMSRPHLVGLVERGEIPHRMVGTHRRIKAGDAMAYRVRRDAEARDAIAEMVRLAQDLDLD